MMRRIVVVVIGIPTAFGLVYLGGWALVGVLALLGVVGTSEYYAMAEKGGAKPLVALGYVAALAIPVIGYLATPAGPGVDPVLAMFGFALWFIAVLGVGVFTRAPDQAPLPALAATVFGPIYTTGLLSLLLMLRHGAPELSRGAATALVFYPLVMTWVCDSFAMSGGSALGGTQTGSGR